MWNNGHIVEYVPVFTDVKPVFAKFNIALRPRPHNLVYVQKREDIFTPFYRGFYMIRMR